HPATGRASWTYTWNVSTTGPVTIRARAIDDSANIQTNGPSVAVTTQCPCQLFGAGISPVLPPASDSPTGLELGTRFTSTTGGSITALRFYKHAGNTGPHIASLWSSSGTLLGQATFTSETASGWQQVGLTAPVPMSPGATYVVSYHSTSGVYAEDTDAFT